jgi:hypothetical protein
MWAASLNGDRPLVMLLGTAGKAAPVLDPAGLAGRVAAAKLDGAQLASVNMASAEAILSHFVAGPEKLAELAGSAQASSDDQPFSELSAARGDVQPETPLTNLKLLVGNWQLVAGCAAVGSEAWDEKLRGRVADLEASRLLLAEACVTLYAELPRVSNFVLDKLNQARKAAPGDPEISYELWSALTLRADACALRGDRRGLDEARGLCEDALDVAPDRRRDYILRRLAVSLSVAGERQRALKLAVEARDADPREPINWEVLSQVAYAAGEKKLGDEARERAADLRSRGGQR